MSYNKSNDNGKQNKVISEETTITTPAVTKVVDAINTGPYVKNDGKIQQYSDGYHLPTQLSSGETSDNFSQQITKSMFAKDDDTELVVITSAASKETQSTSMIAIKEGACAAFIEHLTTNNSAIKKKEIKQKATETDDVVGDGTQMSNFVKDVIVAGATETKRTMEAAITPITTITTSKPPLPPTLLSYQTTPILAPMSTECDAKNLTHTSSDPTFGEQSQMCRNHQQEKMRSYHDTKQTTMWSKDSILGTSSSISSLQASHYTRTTALSSHTGAIIKTGVCSVTVSPCSLRKGSDPSAFPRRVSFPKSDNELVTGYLEPANPWGQACLVKSISEIAELYVMSCRKHKTKPLQTVLDHLKGVELNKQQRQPVLSLKSIKLAASDCEALEEIFKRVQYKVIDLSSCDLDEWATSALFEMIEYYEATNELDISSNSKGMTTRGWTGCIAMVKHSEELRVLVAQGNPISKQSADGLGLAISTSNLHTLKLEHCGLKGALDGLCFKLRSNTTLKELWLAHNDLDCKDAEALGSLLKYNHYIELIDISNNNIRDMGLLYIVEALILQSSELERRSMLHRSSAIDDDDSLSSIEASQTADLDTSDSFSNNEKSSAEESSGTSQSEDKLADVAKPRDDDFTTSLAIDKVTKDTIPETLPTSQAITNNINDKSTAGRTSTTTTATTVSVVASVDDNDGDDDTEDTVKSSNHKNGAFVPSGQSMLDKLLSMNSESSSEDGASNISTDTIAACGSEDASITSDDIFETSIATGTTMSSSNEPHKKVTTDIAVGTAVHLDSLTDLNACQAKSTDEMVLIDITSSETNPASIIFDNSSNGSSAEASVAHSNKHSETLSTTSPLSNDESNGNNNTTSSTISSDNDGDEDDCRKFQDVGRTAAQDQDNQNQNILLHQQENAPNLAGIFEVTAGEGDCTIVETSGAISDVVGGHLPLEQTASILQPSSKAVDVNKNTKLTDDYDDTHSTDSAFESASEGDISRHLPEEYSRLSSSFDGAPIDDIVKGGAIETGTIATESTEYLADAGVTPTSTPTQSSPLSTEQLNVSPKVLEVGANCQTITPNTDFAAHTYASVVKTAVQEQSAIPQTTLKTNVSQTTTTTEETIENVLSELPSLPKVTIATDNLVENDKETLGNRLIPTPPPPSTSPGGASHGMRRTESSVTFITPATRHRSQSSDSLCSDNSLDGSNSSDLNFSTSTQLNEKLTKNDTLTRQQRQSDPRNEPTVKTPSGLKALALWNNSLSKEAGYYIASLLMATNSLELLNIGKNCLSNDFVSRIKDSLMRNTTLTTLGLQSAHLSANGIETLASILTFGGNSTLQRLDIRDNKLEVESLTNIAEVLKSNTTITQIDIDDEPKRLSVGSEAHMDYTRVLENVRSMCSRNEKTQTQLQSDKSHACGAGIKRRSGYYLGSRKISLTCHTRPLFEPTTVVAANTTPTSAVNTKLEAKRKTGARLRSPVPSPPTMSPSSSPNRSRFQVFRVTEVSPLTSPLAQTPPSTASSTSSLATNSNGSTVSMPADITYKSSPNVTPVSSCSSFPTSSSLPSMATVTSSTQSIKRFSVSPRSRFLVSKIYEDPRVPLSSRSLPPITPPIHLPPTPIAKHEPEGAKQALFSSAVEQSPVAVEKIKTVDGILETNNLSTIAAKSSESADKNVEILATLIVTPPTAAIVGISVGNSSTNITEFSQNVNLKELDSTKTIAQMPTSAQQEKDLQQSQSMLQSKQAIQQQQPQQTLTAQIVTEISKTVVCQALDTTSATSSSTQLSKNNTLSPLCSSSSSSSSTSPASLNSNSSSTSTSSPLSAIYSSSSSDSTDGIGGSGIAGGVEQMISLRDELLNAATNRCPLAVFNDSDNDITLTKNSTTDLTTPVTTTSATDESQQRQRKISWMANPGAVDKLRSLFFQRSSSPENKTQSPPQTNPTVIIPSAINNTAVAINNATAFNVTGFVHASLSKVFRQNLPFGNEIAAQTTVTNPLTSVLSDTLSSDSDGSGLSDTALPTEQHNIALIPTELKQEIKENISPEHTINEETLHSLQKLTGIEEAVRSVQEQQHQQSQTGAVALLDDKDATAVNIKPAVLEDFNVKITSNTSNTSLGNIGLQGADGASFVTLTHSLVKEEPADSAASNSSFNT